MENEIMKDGEQVAVRIVSNCYECDTLNEIELIVTDSNDLESIIRVCRYSHQRIQICANFNTVKDWGLSNEILF